VLLINYDFGSDPSFASTFSTTTDAELIYTIPYTPAILSLFATGATAYVSFTRVKFAQTCITYKFDYEIVQITSSSVQLKIRKYGNTVVEALKGQILVISSDAGSKLLFLKRPHNHSRLPRFCLDKDNNLSFYYWDSW